MCISFWRDVVEVIRPAMVERRGVRTPDWKSATTHTLTRCSLQDGTTVTDFGSSQRDPIESDATLFCGPDADIKDGDRVRLGDRTWTVSGVPQRPKSPTGRVSHTKADLKEWRG